MAIELHLTLLCTIRINHALPCGLWAATKGLGFQFMLEGRGGGERDLYVKLKNIPNFQLKLNQVQYWFAWSKTCAHFKKFYNL